ncbi:MAG: DUF1570 domain-containing protein [bacterium]
MCGILEDMRWVSYRTEIVTRAWLALAVMPLLAGAVDFGSSKNYPNIGMKFPNLRNAKADPVPPPEATSYVRVGADTMTRVDLFAPYDLWYRRVCCARWFDLSGNRLILARMSHQLPEASEAMVSRQTFDTLMASAETTFNSSTEAQMKEWVEAFSGWKVYSPKGLSQSGAALNNVYYYPCDKTNVLIYTFQPSQLAGSTSPDWFCVILESPGARDFGKMKAQFEEQFIGKIEIPSRSSKDAGVVVEELDVAKKNALPVDLPDHPVRLEARKSVENYDTWWIHETEGFVILSDVSSEMGKPVVTELLKTMPMLKQAFTKLVPPLTCEPDVSIIRIFQVPEDYINYVGQARAWTGGLWMPARRELVLREVPSTAALSKTLRHEAFHQYLSYAYCLMSAPPWMNEGHACFFENTSVTSKGKLSFDEDEKYVGLILENLETLVAFIPDLMKANYTDFYAGTEAQREMKYALAWGIVYYLQKGAPVERNTEFKSMLPDLAAALAETQSYSTAMETVLGTVDMTVFQSNFKEFWTRRRSSAMQYDPLK